MKSLATKEIDDKLMLIWEESNYCHSDGNWHTSIMELKKKERNLDAGRFVNYLEDKPKDAGWNETGVHDRLTYCDGPGLVETIEWIAENVKHKWTINPGTYGITNIYYFEDKQDQWIFSIWVATKPDIDDAVIPPATIIQLDL